MESLIIFGGTFDPIHNGHLRIASAASLMLGADVIFVPAKAPRWKTPAASVKERVKMLRLALKSAGNASFDIDLYEVNSKAETNYTIDTVKYFAKKYKGYKLYLLIGADSVNTFDRWKDAEEIAKIATVLYVSRPDFQFNEETIEHFNMKRLDYDKSGSVSSSAVRELRNVDIPLEVRDYIEDNNLYYMKKVSEFYTPKRLKHALSVAHLSYQIAQKNRIEHYRNAYIAGLLHDIAKGYNREKAVEVMRKYYPEEDLLPEWTFHQFVGAYLANAVFMISDNSILDAIKYHATGRQHMTPLGKIIYAADKIDPTRGYDSSKLISECYRNYYVGFLAVLEANKEYYKEKGFSLDNPLTIACMDLYLGEHND